MWKKYEVHIMINAPHEERDRFKFCVNVKN